MSGYSGSGLCTMNILFILTNCRLTIGENARIHEKSSSPLQSVITGLRSILLKDQIVEHIVKG